MVLPVDSISRTSNSEKRAISSHVLPATVDCYGPPSPVLMTIMRSGNGDVSTAEMYLGAGRSSLRISERISNESIVLIN